MILQIGFVMFMPIQFLNIVLYLLVGGILVSAVASYYIYLKTKHIEFSYDDESFSLKRGKAVLNYQWRKTLKVLLIKEAGSGSFLIRLRSTEGEIVDIPVSRLKLNPFLFRVKLLEIIRRSKEPKEDGV
jgi:hypothetical protein